MTDAYDVYHGGRILVGEVTEDPDLCFSIEEADSKIISNIARICQKEVKRVFVMSNDTDFLVYSLADYQRFNELEIFTNFGSTSA